jgi:tRNA U34 5-methylaminomethyl-2-thiouridine-forming methyltransferase MnmC
MKREVIETGDGSKTIRIIDLDENYHSTHGALQEAEHVFIKNGLLEFINKSQISIFEMGFGTGLNAFLSAIKANDLKLKIEYTGIEAFPVSIDELNQLGYHEIAGKTNSDLYNKLHETLWGDMNEISEWFSLRKINDQLQLINFDNESFDIVYYDAFGPRAQEEMWSIELFQKMYDSIKEGGFLVTYCAKGQVKRNMKAVGFEVEPLPGPPGKREMTRAWKRGK